MGVAFGSDGDRIVTASEDGTVRMYQCEVCGDVPDLLRKYLPDDVTTSHQSKWRAMLAP